MLQFSAHERSAIHRADDAWLARAWADPRAMAVVISGTRLRPHQGAAQWVASDAAPPGVRIFLGLDEQTAPRFAVLIDPQDAAGPRDEWVGLRSLFGALIDTPEADVLNDAAWLFHAIGLAEWHWSTRHCPRCGAKLISQAAGHELRCSACGRVQFPRTDPAVIMAITHGEPGAPDERLLLGRNAGWPQGRWSTLAGFCEPGESLEDAVRREVAEESGVQVGEVSYVASQPWPLPQSLMIGFSGRAIDPTITVGSDHAGGGDGELAEARWFTREQYREETEAGLISVPRSISISSALIQRWYVGAAGLRPSSPASP